MPQRTRAAHRRSPAGGGRCGPGDPARRDAKGPLRRDAAHAARHATGRLLAAGTGPPRIAGRTKAARSTRWTRQSPTGDSARVTICAAPAARRAGNADASAAAGAEPPAQPASGNTAPSAPGRPERKRGGMGWQQPVKIILGGIVGLVLGNITVYLITGDDFTGILPSRKRPAQNQPVANRPVQPATPRTNTSFPAPTPSTPTPVSPAPRRIWSPPPRQAAADSSTHLRP